MMHQPIWRAGRLGRLAGPYSRLLVPGLLVVVGFVLVVELCSFLTIGAAQGKTFTLSRVTIDPRSARCRGSVAAVLLVGGGLWLRHATGGFARGLARGRWTRSRPRGCARDRRPPCA